MTRINEKACLGCGVCARICPSGIEMRNGVASIKTPAASCLKAAAEACPVQAIILDQAEKDGVPDQDSTSYPQRTGAWQEPNRGQNQGQGMGRGSKTGMGRSSFGGAGGKGRNQGMQLGQGGYCVCPRCGYREAHQRGVPCYETRCPQCNSVMNRA